MEPKAAENSRVWIVTGASGGLGRCLVEHVLECGERVVAATRKVSELQGLLDRFPNRIQVVELDITQPDRIDAMVKEVVRVWGRLDVVVSNAGCALLGGLEECSREQIQRNLTVNLMGPIDLFRAALPILRARRSGHLIAIGAAASITNYPGFAIYGGAKTAVELVAESVRSEVLALGIRVSVVQPGPLRTPFVRESIETAEDSLPEYETSVGRFRQLLGRMDGRQPGNPVLAAAAIFKLSQQDKPPFRLVLGRYAFEKSRKALAARSEELEAFREASVAVDFVRPTE